MFARKYKSELPVKECAYCKSRNLSIERTQPYEYPFNHGGWFLIYFVYCLDCHEIGEINETENQVEWE